MPLGAIFPPKEPTPTKARVQEINKGRKESRSIVSATVSAEAVCFPLAEQAALLLRQTEGRKDELVALITSAEPSRLDAITWLGLNRNHWGVESMHQRLDISHNDDRCRVRNDNAMLVLGIMLRLSNSLFIQWSGVQGGETFCSTTANAGLRCSAWRLRRAFLNSGRQKRRLGWSCLT